VTQRQPEPALERGFIVAVLAQGIDSDEELAELRELADTALVEPVGELVQHRPRPERRTYVGKGKLEELKRAYEESDAEVLLVDDELDPAQQRTLEDSLQARVVDRTQLILDIFAQHARSAEGKLQVELAQLEYNLPRMRGMWKHLERLGGGMGSLGAGVGTRGPGESQLETDRRIARRRITLLRRRLKDLSKQRDVRRRERQRSEAPTVALAGYTNVGKSTLLNALTDADVSVNNRLFETLDPTTRSFEHDGRRYLLTDTVGFIRRLPTQLVQGFAATLEETLVADLILLVVDASAPDDRLDEQEAAVRTVLHEIGADARDGCEQDRRGRRTAAPQARESIPGRSADLRPDGQRPRRAARTDRRTLCRSLRDRSSLLAICGRREARRALRSGRAGRRARRPGGRRPCSRAATAP
jgi:GTPase